ncbi:MAG TPA: hypothetical protein VIL05_14185 [Thermoclostridium sp.]
MNPWLFSFLASVLLFILLADWKQVNINLYGGILSAVFIQAETILAANLGLFEYNLVSLNMPDIFLVSNPVNIFLTGIAFSMGILIVQFYPRKMGYQLLSALVWTLFLTGFNFLLDTFGLVNYLRFKPYFVVRQLLLFLFLAWIKNNFVFQARFTRR